MSTDAKDRALLEVEAEAERLAGAVYGTIVAAGVLVAAGDPGDEGSVDVVDAAIYAVATTLVFWLAHGLSQSLARRAAGHPDASARSALRREWPMVAATGPMLLIMAAATALGADGEDAVAAAVWGSVVVLTLLGVAIVRREGITGPQAILTIAGTAALGGLLVLLKVLLH
jgi:hypothetical protein